LPHIALSPLADPQPTGLAPGGVWPRPQAPPGRKRAAILQMTRRADRRAQGGGRQGPPAGDRPQTRTDGMGLPERFAVRVGIRQSFLQGAKLVIGGATRAWRQAGPLARSAARGGKNGWRNCAPLCGRTMPSAPPPPRLALPKAVRAVTTRSRARCRAGRAGCSLPLIGTKRMGGRGTAAALASASPVSVLFDCT
jgi:hypothetical protein